MPRAARDALNKNELALAIDQASGLALEIISGDQEADWVFRGVATDPKLHGQKLLILDVGGGSTEFIVGQSGDHLFRRSFPVGSLRLLETFPPQDPPTAADLSACRLWLHEFFDAEIRPALEPWLRERETAHTQLVGTGGTVTILARMEAQMADFDRERIEGVRFSRQQIFQWMLQLWKLSLADRRKIIGLPPKRADVILMGTAIYEAVMEHVRFNDLYVSTRGLRFGAALAKA